MVLFIIIYNYYNARRFAEDFMRKTTIKDVAREAGVSITIASFALNNVKGRVSAEVRQKVLESAQKLGYAPNAAARNLRSQNPNTIALMYDESYLEERNASTMQFVAGTIRHAGSREKDILVKMINCETGWEQAYDQSLNLWLSQRVDGIIIQSGTLKQDFLIKLKKAGINFVVIPPDENVEGFHSVYIDNYRLMREGMAFIQSRGYNEVYFLTRQNPCPGKREQGYLDALTEMGLKGRALYYSDSHRGKGELWELLQQLLKESKDRIAVACWNDVDAMNVIDILHTRGIKIPDQVGVMGFDDLPGSEHTHPPLTTIHQPFDEMARVAVDLVLSNADRNENTNIINHEVKGSIVVRESI
jgi:LacI family transcriptional regulator